MTATFDLNFYFKEQLTKKSVQTIINCLTKNGVSFLVYNSKTQSYGQSKNKSQCFIIDDMYVKKLELLRKFRFTVKDAYIGGKNRGIAECIDLILKDKYGYMAISYENNMYKIYITTERENKVSIQSNDPLKFTHSENAKQNLQGLISLADHIWVTAKPFFGSAGVNLETDFNEVKSGSLEGYIGAFAFFNKELIKKIGKERIILRVNKKDPAMVREFVDGSIRIIIHTYDVESNNLNKVAKNGEN